MKHDVEGACDGRRPAALASSIICTRHRPPAYVNSTNHAKQCALLKRLVESTIAAVRATALSNINGQQQGQGVGGPLAVAVALATALRLTAGAFRCVCFLPSSA